MYVINSESHMHPPHHRAEQSPESPYINPGYFGTKPRGDLRFGCYGPKFHFAVTFETLSF